MDRTCSCYSHFDSGAPDFCPDCGSILPLLSGSLMHGMRAGDAAIAVAEGGNKQVRCSICNLQQDARVMSMRESSFTLEFNEGKQQELRVKQMNQERKNDGAEDDEGEGPLVDRKCPRCGHDVMSYATLQLRSADEGQTVFYTCLKCKFKETENS